MKLMLFVLAFHLALTATGGDSRQPIEVGKVKWTRDYEAALAKSKTIGKPVATLFQEAPG